jgi:hypothetical protein
MRSYWLHVEEIRCAELIEIAGAKALELGEARYSVAFSATASMTSKRGNAASSGSA